MREKKSMLKTIADIINPYRWIMEARNRAFDSGLLAGSSFGTPIICIGNISVGGTGKTPHTEYIIRLLKERGKVAVLSRGYGRKTHGYIKADEHSTMPMIGDEPFQIKEKFPEVTVAVCEKRVIGASNLLAGDNAPSVILLDDAYQHRHIKAGLYILLIDYNRPIWNDCTLPFGRLRESDKGTRRADIVIITKCPADISSRQMEDCRRNLKTKEGTSVFFSKVEYGEIYPLFTHGTKQHASIGMGTNVLLLTGIAKPAPLKKEIEERGARVTLMQYADHHNFTSNDIDEIATAYNKMDGKKIILTTEKDATRIRRASNLPQEIKENIYAIPIEIKIIDNKEKIFNQIILDYVTEDSRDSRISQVKDDNSPRDCHHFGHRPWQLGKRDYR